ncbi:MAG TPA: XylR family transcriptional regulator [Spirochaetia bacterium]|nr:XylR family transcriptional regulator [Spirochaetia bacterium]
MGPHRRRRVGMFMGLIDHYEHGIARGVVRFARGRPDWDLYGYGWMFQTMGSLEHWDGDGIIARIESARDADLLASRGIPVVDVAGAWMRPGFRQVSNDDVATGRLAGRHLAGLGRRRFAFCGVSRVGWSRVRCKAFQGMVAADSVAVFEQSLTWWEKLHRSEQLDRWLARLERPAALFACNDTVGLKAAAACRRLGLAVPADIAILGVDNEDILCELSVPPLSSVALDLERIGWEAAAALDDLMNGRAGRAPVVVPPREVVERESTRAITTGDELVDRALGVIHGAAVPGLTVGQILLSVHCSRRTLEKRFRTAWGRSIHQEIIRRRVEAARRLLRDTTLTVEAIAEETGFANPQRFYAAFRKVQGSTPGAYRRSSHF